jgi:hypothetical protein
VKRYYFVASFLLCAGIAACSGSGGNVASAPSPSSGGGSGVAPSLDQHVSFTIRIPAEQAQATRFARRRPASTVYISPATGSISVRVVAVDGTSLQQPPNASTVNVPRACESKGCRVSLTGVPAAVGTDTFAVETFTGADTQGIVISSGVVNVAVTSGGKIDTTIGGSGQLSLGGYVASIALSLGKQLTFGAAGTATVVVSPRDAGGATIIGNVQFANPIVLALASPEPGLTLTGPNLNSAIDSVSLTGPESTATLVQIDYNGNATPAPAGANELTASTVNSAGATVTAAPLLVLATPSPVSVTPLPVAPSPVASGGKSRFSLYVLSAADNTVTEFTEPATAGQAVETNPRRVFGGKTVASGCQPILGTPPKLAVNGVAVDARSNAYISSTNPCSSGGATADVFGPTAILDSNPAVAAAALSNPGAVGTLASIDAAVAYDEPAGTLDVGDNSNSDALRKFRLPLPATQPAPILGFNPALPLGSYIPCFAITTASGQCTSLPAAVSGSDFDALNNLIPTEFPFAVGPDGSLYVATADELAFVPGQPLGQRVALVRISPSRQKTSQPTFVDPAYIEGDQTELTQVISLAVDSVNKRLWVLASGIVPNGGPPIADPQLFENQEYLLAFDLSTFDGPAGAYEGPPVAAYGQGRFPITPPAGDNYAFANSLTAGNGRVYVANPLGPAPLAASFANRPQGEIDVYDGGIKSTGGKPGYFHLGFPSTVVYGYDVKIPVGVAFGPRGSTLSVPAGARR